MLGPVSIGSVDRYAPGVGVINFRLLSEVMLV